MSSQTLSIRPFVGSRDFMLSRNFYTDLGFSETAITPELSLFTLGNTAFYLQNAYVKDWVDNTMIFVEVDDTEAFWQELNELNLSAKYNSVKLVPIRTMDWGKECFVHDPSGILWHFGEFFKK